MKKLIYLVVLISITISPSYAQDIILDNGEGIQFKAADGAQDGTQIKRFGGNALRFQYKQNVLVFDALDDKAIQVRSSNGALKHQLNPAGNSFFNGGRVGIGTSVPLSSLDVNGSAVVIRNGSAPRGTISGAERLRMTAPTADYVISTQDGTGRVQHYWNSSVGPNPTYQVANEAAGKILFSPASGDLLNLFYAPAGTAGRPIAFRSLFNVKSNGNVGVGVSNPTAKLQVNGGVKAKSVEVTLSGFPDFVFEENYKLPTLQEVENYIQQHKHLPGVPSEKEILSDGLNLGEMDAIMMQKIEELTLYVIDLKKENEALKAKVETLSKH